MLMAGNKISVRALDTGDGLGLKTMAESYQPINFDETLKLFHQRASQAEDRLSRLEAALLTKKDAGDKDYFKIISELQSKFEKANAELVSERKKAENLAAENEKLKYRVKHLILAVEAADRKLESK